MPDTTLRLDKFLSNAGIISRRGVKFFLKSQQVTVNDRRVTESGTRILPSDSVKINGKKVIKPGFVYFLLNKPKGVISTTSDEFARDTVTSLIDTHERIYPVGRLDKDTHGLLLLTNDGELTHKLIHPKYHVPKVYRLVVEGKVTDSQINRLKNGILLEDGPTLPAEVKVVGHKEGTTTLEVIIHEGRNRQIRRMCDAVHLNLIDLQRIAFGPLTLGGIDLRKYRVLTKKEVDLLKKAVEKIHLQH